MPNWEGHRPATSVVLLDLITTAHSGSMTFSRAERVLFTACEFWAAARNKSLASQLSDDPAGQLRAAEQAFAAMGLNQSALVLRCGRMALTTVHSPTPLDQVAENIETALGNIEEPVDEVIAEFASEKTLDRNVRPSG